VSEREQVVMKIAPDLKGITGAFPNLHRNQYYIKFFHCSFDHLNSYKNIHTEQTFVVAVVGQVPGVRRGEEHRHTATFAAHVTDGGQLTKITVTSPA
jgi:hypothetical protein